MVATYVTRKRNSILEIRIAGFAGQPQQWKVASSKLKPTDIYRTIRSLTQLQRTQRALVSSPSRFTQAKAVNMVARHCIIFITLTSKLATKSIEARIACWKRAKQKVQRQKCPQVLTYILTYTISWVTAYGKLKLLKNYTLFECKREQWDVRRF